MAKEAETEMENKTIKSQTTSSSNKASPSFKARAGILKLDKGIPIVLLKSVFAAAGGYQCDLCNQNFTKVSQLVKHKQLHEKKRSFMCEICGRHFRSEAHFTEHQGAHKPSFQCNMCDRSFATSHNLKRHKLLHVKDGRKCPKCGVLFCRRHKHVLYQPQAESVTELEQDSSVTEPQHVGDLGDLMPENNLLEEPKPINTADLDDNAQSTTTAKTVSPAPPNIGPQSKTHGTLPPGLYTRVLSEIPVPVLLKRFSVPSSPRPVPAYQGTSSLPDYPVPYIQPHLPQHPELPPSLNIFSPQCLTSAILEVKRNYEYILSKPKDVKNERVIVKEEQCELPLISPDERRVQPVKKEKTAYDLAIVL